MSALTFLEKYILNKFGNFMVLVLVQGETQMGKSTFVFHFINKLSKLIFGEDWDFKKYCARSFEEFIEIFDKYNDRFIVYEEASKDISIDEWYSNINHFFNVIMQTQAYKHNIVVIIFPQSLSISSRQRRFINLGIEVIKKINTPETKAVVVKPTIYKRTYWKLDEDDLRYIFLPICYIKYSDEDLKKSTEYTDWLVGSLKTDVMKDIKAQLKRHNAKKRRKIAKEERESDEDERTANI